MLFRYDINIDSVIDKLLSRIPTRVWKSSTTTFIDPAAGGGQFLTRIANKLRSYGHSDANIRRRIVGVFGLEMARNYAIRMGVPGVLVCDILEVNSMDFDVTCGNPPYQDGNGKSSNKLWKEFTKLALTLTKDNGYIAFVTPPSWMSPGSLYSDLMAYDMQYVNLNIDHYFTVGSEFSAWVLKKRPSINTTTFETSDGVFVVEHANMSFLPKKIHPLAISITQKMLSTGSRFKFIANNENDTRKSHMSVTKTKAYRWKIAHTNVSTYWSNKKPSEYNTPKVMITRSGDPRATYSDSCGVSQVMYYIKVKNAIEGARMVNVLSSKLYYVVMEKLWKYSGWNQLDTLRSLPAVDCNIDWTDEMLYKHFKLTKDEIAYVESLTK